MMGWDGPHDRMYSRINIDFYDISIFSIAKNMWCFFEKSLYVWIYECNCNSAFDPMPALEPVTDGDGVLCEYSTVHYLKYRSTRA